MYPRIFATAIASASEDFYVIMAGRSVEKEKCAMSEIENTGVKGSLSIVQLDVTDEKSIKQAMISNQGKHGRLNVLVNNAAVGSMDPNIKTRLQLCTLTLFDWPWLLQLSDHYCSKLKSLTLSP